MLAQAEKRGLRRIFVVLPFTNIIRQSVEIYREALVLPGEDPEEVVAELHHRAEFEREDMRHLTALWRAPVVVTTAVAFFETLAANSPATLRRLHELPGSAVFVDEAHAALPAKLLPLAWKWINIFAKEWGCYWVFASGSLCRFWEIPEIRQSMVDIDVPEIVDESLRDRLRLYENNRVRFRSDLSPKSVDSIVEWIHRYAGPRLVIVNTVNNAAVLASRYRDRYGRAAVEHLSTSLTPKDRDKTLARVISRLRDKDDTDWVLVATTCVEAGVNLSFRIGFRELGSLASLLQVSGRINREGDYPDAEVWTFVFSDSSDINENPAVKDAAEVLRSYFADNATISQDLCTNAISDEIRLRGVSKVYKELLNCECDRSFMTVEKKFKVIEASTRLVVVDEEIASRVKHNKISWKELQKNSVQIWFSKLDGLKLRRIIIGNDENDGIDGKDGIDEIYLWDLGYDDFLGYMAGILFAQNPENYII
jgi:CRISPR/Cas system-associated endonuclease/helicase Cas3